jgi:hypothetical protein
MEDIIWLARMSFSIVNIFLLILLIYLFVQRYRDIRSKFNLGFLLIVLSLFFRTLFSSPVIRFVFLGVEAHSIVDPYRLVADFFEFIALTTFLYISTR